MAIRSHRREDADAIATILADGWGAAYGSFMPSKILRHRTDHSARRAEIAAFLDEDFSPASECILISESGTLEGFCHIVCEDKASLAAAAHINLLYVDPSLFGRGIGRALMEAAGEWLHQHVEGAIVLSAYAKSPFHSFYAHIGGEIAKRATATLDGHELDVIYYRWPNAAALMQLARG